MKNISALLLSLALSAPAFAQTEATATTTDKDATCYSFKSINGHEVLPQKGDWAIGVSATSFLYYVGNMMNGNTSNPAPTFSTANQPNAFAIGNLGGVALLGKYMKDYNMAYRFRFQLNAGNTSYRNLVLQDLATPDPLNPKYVEDKQSTNSYAILLGAGFEKRRGNSRLQGVYGAEALLGVAGASTEYTYGNKFTSDFPTPMSTTDFSTGAVAAATDRVSEESTGTMFLFGVRGFAGVEYFLAPKISLGGEIGYTLGFSTFGEGETSTQFWNGATSSVTTVKTKEFSNNGLRSWGLGLDNVNAGINFNFYF